MRKLAFALLGTGALAICASSAASAADLKAPIRKAPSPPVVAVYDWTGFYIGGHVGGAWFEKDWLSSDPSDPLVPVASLGSHDASGFIAGGQIGFNWQAPGSRWVFGVEAQASWADLKGDHVIPNDIFRAHTQTDFIGTIAGRIGYAWDRWLLYVKGGAAWAHDEYKISNTVPISVAGGSVVPAGSTFFSGDDETRWGWMVGAGAELALSGNWSAKLEYNYMDLGKKGVTFSAVPPVPPTSFAIDIDQQIHAVKFGINYRFGPSPIVARY